MKTVFVCCVGGREEEEGWSTAPCAARRLSGVASPHVSVVLPPACAPWAHHTQRQSHAGLGRDAARLCGLWPQRRPPPLPDGKVAPCRFSSQRLSATPLCSWGCTTSPARRVRTWCVRACGECRTNVDTKKKQKTTKHSVAEGELVFVSFSLSPSGCVGAHIHSWSTLLFLLSTPYLHPPPQMSAAPRVELTTSMGALTVELYVQHAPRTCRNFAELSKKGYYDGTVVSWVENGEKGMFIAHDHCSPSSTPTPTHTVPPHYPQLCRPRWRPHRHRQGGRVHLRPHLWRRTPPRPAPHGRGRAEHGQRGAGHQRQPVSGVVGVALVYACVCDVFSWGVMVPTPHPPLSPQILHHPGPLPLPGRQAHHLWPRVRWDGDR